MLKNILAYLISFPLAVLISGLSGFLGVFLIVVIKSLPSFFNKDYFIEKVGLIDGPVAGIVSIWVAKIVFSKFNLKLPLLMIIFLAIGFGLNDLRRIRRAHEEVKRIEMFNGLGDLAGLMMGTIIFWGK